MCILRSKKSLAFILNYRLVFTNYINDFALQNYLIIRKSKYVNRNKQVRSNIQLKIAVHVCMEIRV